MSRTGCWDLSDEGRALPFPIAATHIAQALAGLTNPSKLAAEQPGGWRVLRLEQPVSLASDPVSAVFGFLAAQQGVAPRVLFGTRDRSLLLAGVGAAHIHTISDTTSKESSDNGAELLPWVGDQTDERICYVGGVRFDAGAASTRKKGGNEWDQFNKCYWVLPRVTLTVRRAREPVDASKSDASESQVSSVTVQDLDEGGSRDRQRVVVLGVHLRWKDSPDADNAPSLDAERSAALAVLKALPASSRFQEPIISNLTGKSEQQTQEDFNEMIQRALEAFGRGSMEKVVLARKVELSLSESMDPVHILRHIFGDSKKRTYLFMLEIAKGAAFISLTPERLCKTEGNELLTEAVAGTWPIADYESLGEQALLQSSEKNNSEHRITANYICNLLREVADDPREGEPYITKLKDLVHIKSTYRARARSGDVGKHPGGLPGWFRSRMSPTPAVCGLPRDVAQEFITENEPWDRGFYAGPCGILSAQGCEFMVALRSANIQDGQRLHVYGGAGIVPGSTPEGEYAEINLKVQQFTKGFPHAPEGYETAASSLDALASLPNINTLWCAVLVEELVRLNVCNFVICPGSRSTPFVVAVKRHPRTRTIVNHDERGAAFFALGWAKDTGAPTGVIVTSGSAVANLLPAAVEASASCVPLLILSGDRPHELRETGANQVIMQPGIFGEYVRWEKDFPPPSIEYPLRALLSDVDLAEARVSGRFGGDPGPVHLNFCFRENLAPEGGAVRDAAHYVTSGFDRAYVQQPDILQWLGTSRPKGEYVCPRPQEARCEAVAQLVSLVRKGSRIAVVVGTLTTTEDILLAEDLAARLRAIVFADITSGLRQQPGTVHYADQLLNSPLLAGNHLRVDAIVQLGGPLTSRRISGFIKAAAAPLHLRITPHSMRLDPEHGVTHHLRTTLSAFTLTLVEAGLYPLADFSPCPSPLWEVLSYRAGQAIDMYMEEVEKISEPFVAREVSSLLPKTSRLVCGSSMPIRDLDMYAKPWVESDMTPRVAPMSNRGASGIDGVVSTAIGYCYGRETHVVLLIGDVSFLHDLNSLQQLAGPDAPPVVVVIQNNRGGGIFSMLPIAKHRDVFSPCFDEPHNIDFAAACRAFGIPYEACTTPDEFTAAFVSSQQGKPKATVIEACHALSHQENGTLHKRIGDSVSSQVRSELLSQWEVSWSLVGGGSLPPVVLLGGWMGSKADWAPVVARLVKEGHSVLTLDLPGQGATEMAGAAAVDPTPWKWSLLFSAQLIKELAVELMESLRIGPAVLVGYSMGGRVAMEIAESFPSQVLGVVVLSANPGMPEQASVERQQRLQNDAAIANRLIKTSSAGGEQSETLAGFLDWWYKQPLFADLSKRRPEVYKQMIERRLQISPMAAASVLEGVSLAKQQDFWPKLGRSKPFLYASGSLDKKFAAIGQRLGQKAQEEPGLLITVKEIPDAGHALVEECPEEVAKLCLEAARSYGAAWTPPKHLSVLHDEAVLHSAFCREEELDLRYPLILSRGVEMRQRSGLLIVLRLGLPGDSGAGEATIVVAGLGEVCPMPAFHVESLADAEVQVRAVLAAWTEAPPSIPLNLATLDGRMGEWLAEHTKKATSGAALLPSVLAGLEMALLHALGRIAGAPHLAFIASHAHKTCCQSSIGINGLLAYEEDLGAASGDSSGSRATVFKVKVGKAGVCPTSEAKRINSVAQALASHGPTARLRLDANRGWSVEDATTFISNLSDSTVGLVEYIEEPCALPEIGSLADTWISLYEATGRRLKFAVDESLTEQAVELSDLERCRDPIAALVLKPSLQSFERSAELSAWALQGGVQPIISSAFESGVALCHYAIFASSMAGQVPVNRDGRGTILPYHGLGTFSRLEDDVLRPPFAELVYGHGPNGWRVVTLQCQRALDATVDGLVATSGMQQL